MKIYYVHFIKFTQKVGGNTWEAMRKLLAYEMDVMTIMLKLNMLRVTDV